MTTKVPLETPSVELIYDDGEPMDSPWHGSQMNLLLEQTHDRFGPRTDYYTGGNMFVYYSLKQAGAILAEEAADQAWSEGGQVGERPKKTEFRGPDYFCVLGVDGLRQRKAWVIWEEDGRSPDLVVELLSRSTRKKDLGEKKDLYERTFKTQEYVCYDPGRDELLAWRLVEGKYVPIEADDDGRIWSEILGCFIGRWSGVHHKMDATWLRLYDDAGDLVPLSSERAEAERARADEERARADEARARADEAHARADEAHARADEAHARADEARARADEARARADEEHARAEAEHARADAAEAELARLRKRLGE